ncbi:MAG: hypothetical protein H5U01_00620 [Clostridia bacterium]|nr:hypothetical protein [Clostridia bacterium]
MSGQRENEQGCPLCGGHRVGQVGSKQFFCWNCLVEYNHRREVFLVTEEGTLVAYSLAGGENRVV